jgi:hypothetical protein
LSISIITSTSIASAPSVASGESQSSQFVAEKEGIGVAAGVLSDEFEALLDGDVSRALGIAQKE